jgi:trimeric autotransporter adhesin
MIAAVRNRLTYSNVIGTIALFIALGGVAVAAGLPRNSVGANQLKRGAVTAAKIRKQAVTSAKLAPKSVINGKLGPNSVGPGNIGNGAVTTAKLAKASVIAETIKNSVITTNKLNNEAVTTPKLANEAVTSAKLGKGSVTAAKLSDEIGPLLSTLKSGQTLRGTFDVGSAATAAGDLTRGAVSYQFPLLNAPAATVLHKGETSANCSGLGSGAGQTPQATPGNLCVYVTEEVNLDGVTPLAAENNTRLGFGLVAKAKEATSSYFAYGQWAVTAP